RLHGSAVMQGDLGRLAEQKGQSSRVRDFGARLARDQEDADAGLLTYAARHGVNAQAMYAASEQRRLNEAEVARLGLLPGPVFDRELASAVEQRQVEAIEVVQAARQSIDDPELRALLGQMLPALEAQVLTAQGLLSR